MFYKIKTKKNVYIFPQYYHIIIDDMHLHSEKNNNYIEFLSLHRRVLYINENIDSTNKNRQILSNNFKMKQIQNEGK